MTPTYSMGNAWTFKAPPHISIVPPCEGRRIDAIVRWVAAKHQISVKDLLGNARYRHIAWPRFEAMWLARQERRPDGTHLYSLPQIGNHFRRDHTSVLHALRRHEQFMAERRAA